MDNEQFNSDVAEKLSNVKKVNETEVRAEYNRESALPSKALANTSKQSSLLSIISSKLHDLKSALIIDKEKQNDIRKLKINNCKDLDSALKFMVSPIIKEEQENLQSVLHIRFKIEQAFQDIDPTEIENLSNKFSRKAVVLLLFSTSKNGKFFIFWKSKEIQHFLTLNTFGDNCLKNEKKIYKFIADFLASSLEDGHLGIHENYADKPEITKFELFFLADSRNYNLLLLAAEIGEADIVESLLKIGMDTEIPQLSINAQELAWKGRHSNVLLVLVRANLTYPASFDLNQASEELQNFHRMCIELHEAVVNNNGEKVEEILDQNQKFQYFYNFKNESVAKIAILNKCYESYKLLISRKIFLATHEDFEKITVNFEYGEKRALREIHFEHKKDLGEKHLNILMLNSFVSHDVPDVQGKLDQVKKAYQFLNQNVFLRIILLVVAASKNFKIIYDFNRESVNVADPTVDSNTQGLFYLSGRIYIGAKQLLDKLTEKEAYATLAHELCHYAMHLVYGNDANPYSKNDLHSIQEFEEISRKCQEKSDKEDVIDAVYKIYSPDMFHAELIVRVPHMLVLYHDQPEKIKESRDNFGELYDHYEHKVMPEMEIAIPVIETKDERKREARDKKILRLKRKYYWTIGLAFLAVICSISALVYVLVMHNYAHRIFKFEKLDQDMQKSVNNSEIIFKNNTFKIRDLFENNPKFYSDLTKEHVNKFLKGDILDIIDPIFEKVNTKVFNNWTDLPKKLKENFLDSKSFLFQDKTVKFDYFNPKVFNSLTFQEINNVFEGKLLKVGKEIKNEAKPFVERKFVAVDYLSQGTESPQLNLLENSDQKDTDQIIQVANENKIFILSSKPREGKSFAFRQIALKVKQQNPMLWVSFIDLKDYTKFYNESRNFSEFYFWKLMNVTVDLKAESEFGREVFMESWDKGNVVLIWDNFDDVTKYKDFLLKIFGYVRKNTTNVQFIVTSPTYDQEMIQKIMRNFKNDNSEENLTFQSGTSSSNIANFSSKTKNSLPQILFHLVPYNKDEQEEFLRKSFVSEGATEKEVDQAMKTMRKLMKRLKIKAKFDTSNREFNTPFLLKIFRQAYTKNILNSENIYEIFSAFLEPFKNTYNLYQKEALKSELAPTNSTVFLKLYKLDVFRLGDSMSVDFCTGISLNKNNNVWEFSHKSFSEFFVAQYLIENIYNSSTTDEPEAELRLELFFYVIRTHGYFHSGIIEFIKDFLKTDKSRKMLDENRKYFSIAELLKGKFNKFFINLLNTEYPENFDFLAAFFGWDCSVLESLLQVNERETFFTAIFNPIHDGIQVNPSDISEYECRSSIEVNISGLNQKGILLFGSFVKGTFRINHSSKYYEKITQNIDLINFNEISLWDVANLTLNSLNIEEKKEFCQVLLNPKIFLNFGLVKMSYYEEFWGICEELFTKSEVMRLLIGNGLKNVLETDPNKFLMTQTQFLKFYIQKAKMLIINESILGYEGPSRALVTNNFTVNINLSSDDTIFNIFKQNFILHKAARSYSLFRVLWDFFVENSNKYEQKEILKLKDEGDFYHFYDKPQNSPINQYYDNTGMKILHRGLLAIGDDRELQLNAVIKIYNDLIEPYAIKEIISKDNVFFSYIFHYSDEDFCKKIAYNFINLFKGNLDRLTAILSRVEKRVDHEFDKKSMKNLKNFMDLIQAEKENGKHKN